MTLPKNNRGIALLITLSVMLIIIAFALELSQSVRATLISVASGHRDRMTLSYMAAGGIQVTMGLLAKNKELDAVNAIQEDFVISDAITEAMESIPFENGKLSVQVIDEKAKIQINALFKDGKEVGDQINLLRNFLEPRIEKDKKNSMEISSVIERIIERLDPSDDRVSQSKDNTGKGPFIDLGELTQIKGITPELIKTMGGFDELSKYITVYGATSPTGTGLAPTADSKKKNAIYDGKININTAELPVLTALVGDPKVAEEIYKFREDMKDDQYLPDWYKQFPLNQNLITNLSDFFRIEATATMNDVKLKATAVVHREQNKKSGKWTCKILSWQTS
jgi:general secretion pathway protein K